MILHCEFCEQQAKWWMAANKDYIRYSCKDHIDKVRKLIRLDFGIVTYIFGPVNPVTQELETYEEQIKVKTMREEFKKSAEDIDKQLKELGIK